MNENSKIKFSSKIIKAILDVGTQNLDLGDEMLEKSIFPITNDN
jgi:hypothetical protein